MLLRWTLSRSLHTYKKAGLDRIGESLQCQQQSIQLLLAPRAALRWHNYVDMKTNAALLLPLLAALASAQVPPDIEASLVKIGHIVDPACTAKLYRPLMPKNDINSNVTPLYPGITIARDVSFGPHPKDLIDIFTADKGPANRTVLMYLPGG